MADTLDFQTAWAQVIPYIKQTAVSLFLNGMYNLLVVVALYFLSRREPGPGKRILICTILVMCTFAAVEMALQLVAAALALQAVYSAALNQVGDALDSLQDMSNMMGFVEETLLVVNNAIADGFFMYRCYMIWGRNRNVVILPLVLLMATIGLGFATVYRNHFSPPQYHIDSRILFGLIMFNNLLLTCLTAAPIWRSRRHLKILGQTKFIRRYNTALTMVLESSSIYFVCTTVGVLLLSLPGGPLVSVVPQHSYVYGVGTQLTNILPTLIIVQASLSRHIDASAVTKKLAPV
ncbi:hypothetical protein FB45DRAFT_896460 [Roridomyces roridus]|uniref:Uncharacterized protein n=1 Tax=Roridomyces roridus TaxID=1738132 RepID=A0AAD7CAN4_9AGAR|nr:hypothetical protein FB45DRAFT_896460 [Roridomyces roridus]